MGRMHEPVSPSCAIQDLSSSPSKEAAVQHVVPSSVQIGPESQGAGATSLTAWRSHRKMNRRLQPAIVHAQPVVTLASSPSGDSPALTSEVQDAAQVHGRERGGRRVLPALAASADSISGASGPSFTALSISKHSQGRSRKMNSRQASSDSSSYSGTQEHEQSNSSGSSSSQCSSGDEPQEGPSNTGRGLLRQHVGQSSAQAAEPSGSYGITFRDGSTQGTGASTHGCTDEYRESGTDGGGEDEETSEESYTDSVSGSGSGRKDSDDSASRGIRSIAALGGSIQVKNDPRVDVAEASTFQRSDGGIFAFEDVDGSQEKSKSHKHSMNSHNTSKSRKLNGQQDGMWQAAQIASDERLNSQNSGGSSTDSRHSGSSSGSSYTNSGTEPSGSSSVLGSGSETSSTDASNSSGGSVVGGTTAAVGLGLSPGRGAIMLHPTAAHMHARATAPTANGIGHALAPAGVVKGSSRRKDGYGPGQGTHAARAADIAGNGSGVGGGSYTPADGMALAVAQLSGLQRWPYQLHIAMELVLGDTLDAWLRNRNAHMSDGCEVVGVLGLESQIFRQVVLGLSHCHAAGIIHRVRTCTMGFQHTAGCVSIRYT